MLHDRPYMRADSSSAQPPSALKWLLLINLGVFILGRVVDLVLRATLFGQPVFDALFALSGQGLLRGFIWTPLTYSLLHDSFLHLLFNMLGLYFIGRILEPRLGTEKMVLLYGTGALVGGVVWLLFNAQGTGSVVGASAALMAILTVFCLQFWNQPLQLLFIPLVVKPKWLFAVVFGLDSLGFLFGELGLGPGGPTVSGVAHSAHLGGYLGGWLFARYLIGARSVFIGRSAKVEAPSWLKGRKSAPKTGNVKVNLTGDRAALKSEVDRILDKINTKGFGSLTEEEKTTLDRARDLLNR